MRILTRLSLVLLVSGAGLTGAVPPAFGEALPQQVTIITPDTDPTCVGDVVTAAWNRPGDIADLTGYRVVRFVTTMNPPWTFTDDVVGPEQTSLTFAADFGVTIISIYPITSDGVSPTRFASGVLSAGRAPLPMEWHPEGAGVGNGTATVPFRWFGPKVFVNSGNLTTTVEVTASPGGATVVLANGAATFEGLSNGVGYTFSAVTSNACGSSESHASPTYTPGVAPSWTKATPPAHATSGQYVYNFSAEGDRSPTYRLVGAPSWLTISPKGVVSGRPPAATESFTYSVVASNGVGIAYYQNTDVVAGPFAVSMKSP